MRASLRAAVASALALAGIATAVGLAVNAASSGGLSLGAGRSSPVAVAALGAARAAHVNDAATFIDARTEAAYRRGHIAGALNVPYAEREERRDGLVRAVARTRPLIVYCTGVECQLGPELADWLREQGWRDVRVLVDGFPGWHEAGYPTVVGPRP